MITGEGGGTVEVTSAYRLLQCTGTFQELYSKYWEMIACETREINWEPRVFIYDEMNELLEETHGDEYVNYMKEFKTELEKDESFDSRMCRKGCMEIHAG